MRAQPPAPFKTPHGVESMPNTYPTLELLPARIEHAYALAPHMKQADREEVKAASGLEPLEVLLKSLELSEKAYAILEKDEVIALGGLAPLTEHIGIPWALTSNKIALYPKQFCRIAKELIKGFHKSYPLLSNFCDAQNTTTIRWLKWCGFQFVATIPEFGVIKTPFLQFESKLCLKVKCSELILRKPSDSIPCAPAIPAKNHTKPLESIGFLQKTVRKAIF